MASLILQNNSHLVIFINDRMSIYNTCNEEHQLINIADPIGAVVKGTTANRNVLAARFSESDELLALILNNKQLIIYDKHFEVVCNLITNRICSNIRFTKQNDIIVVDKTGDAYLYKLKNTEEPELLLGHLSMLLDVALSDCGKFLITCDRDEKIRISCFPNCYNIMSYCLGHTEFVTNVEVSHNSLISGSGDGTIRVWDFMNGKQLCMINTNDHVSDKNIIESFCRKMDDESVDIQALPLTDLKVYQTNNITLIAVTLLNFKGVQVYEIFEKKLQFKQSIMIDSNVLCMTLSTQLFLLTHDKVLIYELQNNQFVKVNSLSLIQLCSNYNISNQNDDFTNISALYKRKYDNVQEYLDKKRLRLSNS